MTIYLLAPPPVVVKPFVLSLQFYICYCNNTTAVVFTSHHYNLLRNRLVLLLTFSLILLSLCSSTLFFENFLLIRKLQLSLCLALCRLTIRYFKGRNFRGLIIPKVLQNLFSRFVHFKWHIF